MVMGAVSTSVAVTMMMTAGIKHLYLPKYHDDFTLPSAGLLCNMDTHQCKAPPGKVLVESIKVFTSGCTGCSASNEGVTVELLGEKNANFFDGVPCSTRVLDHKATTDFASSGSAVFDGKKNGHEDEGERTMMGTCYEVTLNLTKNNLLTLITTGSPERPAQQRWVYNLGGRGHLDAPSQWRGVRGLAGRGQLCLGL